ncbi:unnamed protein product [Arctogadus glacialis]
MRQPQERPALLCDTQSSRQLPLLAVLVAELVSTENNIDWAPSELEAAKAVDSSGLRVGLRAVLQHALQRQSQWLRGGRTYSSANLCAAA